MPRLSSVAIAICVLAPLLAGANERPNILFIISEDSGPELGCYGDEYAVSPHIDRLASEGLRYEFCWSNAPVCAPARTTLISGLYPTSTGAEHMRSLVRLPATMKLFPAYLREGGYFTANLRKEDLNVEKKGKIWDLKFKRLEERPWREAEAGQPFFAIFNISTSHESQIRERPHELLHDPAKAPLPAYHPDTPEVRHDWAQYYDKLTAMDREVGGILKRLKEDGHADDTIVFYFGDHGSGMPRSKRWPYDSGLHVPLIIRIPEAYKNLRPEDYEAGGATGRLVSFVDFGPTVLSLAGVEAPDYYQGSAFLGEYEGEPNQFLHGFRGRMDERIDLVRSVTDGRYVYIRNYMPHRIYGQHIGYMFQTPTTRVWKRLYEMDELKEVQSAFWEPKPAEELYDLEADPDEVVNLVDSAEHHQILERIRTAQQEQIVNVRDVGFLPEPMLHARCEKHGVTPYELGHHKTLYPLEEIFKTAEIAARRGPSVPEEVEYPKAIEKALGGALTVELLNRLDDSDAAVRYWALTGLLVRGKSGFGATGAETIAAMLDDSSASVRIVAAELRGRYGSDEVAKKAVKQLLRDANYQNTSEYAATSALLVLDELLTARPELVEPHAEAIKELPLPKGEGVNPRAADYPGRLKERILERLEGE